MMEEPEYDYRGVENYVQTQVWLRGGSVGGGDKSAGSRWEELSVMDESKLPPKKMWQPSFPIFLIMPCPSHARASFYAVG